MTIKIGIIGATGYTGIELIRILARHPEVKITYLGSQSYAGQMLSHVYPHLQHVVDLQCQAIDVKKIQEQCDLVFTALPHGEAMHFVPALLNAGLKIIDLGPDFRLKNGQDYSKWYQHTPAPAAFLKQAVYGLAEAGWRQHIHEARLLANPGCYATAAILTALPALKHDLINPNDCIFDGKSGVSGAGRTLVIPNHFCEATANFRAYQIAGAHRHTPEIEQALSIGRDEAITVQFTPHVTAMSRGLFMTSYFKLKASMSSEEVMEVYQQYYANEYFIRLLTAGQNVQTNQVAGTNFCHLSLAVDSRCQRLIVLAAIDNLGKGAAGQAVQNMNLMFGLRETMGLDSLQAMYV